MSRVTPVLLYSLTGAVVLSSLSSCKEKKSEEVKKTMNVVYIMCDDHSYQTISAYDQRYMQTPNIDRIANEGVRFTNSFVANSLSGPSRACMLTGKHSHACLLYTSSAILISIFRLYVVNAGLKKPVKDAVRKISCAGLLRTN